MRRRPLPPFSLDFLSQGLYMALYEQNTQASRLKTRDMSFQDWPSQMLWGLGYRSKLLPVTEEDVCVFLHKKPIVYFMGCSEEQRVFIFIIATFFLASLLNIHWVEMIGFSTLWRFLILSSPVHIHSCYDILQRTEWWSCQWLIVSSKYLTNSGWCTVWTSTVTNHRINREEMAYMILKDCDSIKEEQEPSSGCSAIS